jgi:hypothetical protein
VNVEASARLTRGIRRGRLVARRTAARRRFDERFDPAKALDAAARYLVFSRRELGGREDLGVAAYHMGVGNLQGVLQRFGEGAVPYTRLFFDSTPRRHPEAWARLAALGDDSATYWWRVLAAREIMRLHRSHPAELTRRARLHAGRPSAAALLHPPPTEGRALGDFEEREAALEDGRLIALDTGALGRLSMDITPGATAPVLAPRAVAVLGRLSRTVQAIAPGPPLLLTAATDAGLADAGDPHESGHTFDVSRTYASEEQAQAFQFALDRMQALGELAWSRGGQAIHVTAAGA